VHYAQDEKAIIPVINIMQQVQNNVLCYVYVTFRCFISIKNWYFLDNTRIEFIISFYFVMHVIVRT
jgi:hypothetical protein